MSDLTRFRDHARFMAEREHAPECWPERTKPSRLPDYLGRKWCGDEKAHDGHEWTQPAKHGGWEPIWVCVGICGGCNRDDDQALWKRLADEVDTYLDRPPEEDLFGEMSVPAVTEENA